MSSNILAEIKRAFENLFHGIKADFLISLKSSGGSASLGGKIYELQVLYCICLYLSRRGYSLRISSGSRNTLPLRMSHGPVDVNRFSYIMVEYEFMSIFTNIYCAFFRAGGRGRVSSWRRHEIDIAVLRGTKGFPKYPSGEYFVSTIECKRTSLKKSYLREALAIKFGLECTPKVYLVTSEKIRNGYSGIRMMGVYLCHLPVPDQGHLAGNSAATAFCQCRCFLP